MILPHRRGAALAILGALALVAAACSSNSEGAVPAASTSEVSEASTTTVTVPTEKESTELGSDERPAQLVAPDEVSTPAPLLVLLHGYGSNAEQQDAYLGVSEQAASRGLYVLLPDGTPEPSGRRYWDATPACCNFAGPPVDDVGYIRSLVREAIDVRPIDPARVYVFGHSNGGFMTYRLACDLADELIAVAVLAGSEPPGDQACQPTVPVSVLHIHGTDDPLVSYGGGQLGAPFAGAAEVVARWAGLAGCDAEAVEGEPVDLDGGIAGAETAVLAYEGCDDGLDVQLDSIEGGGHIPAFNRDHIGTDVLDWLLAHSR